MEFMFQNIQV